MERMRAISPTPASSSTNSSGEACKGKTQAQSHSTFSISDSTGSSSSTTTRARQRCDAFRQRKIQQLNTRHSCKRLPARLDHIDLSKMVVTIGIFDEHDEIGGYDSDVSSLSECNETFGDDESDRGASARRFSIPSGSKSGARNCLALLRPFSL